MDQPTPIQVAPWTADWQNQFELEAQRIHCAIPHLELHHIGSTAVPGCTAKPIVDIMGLSRRWSITCHCSQH